MTTTPSMGGAVSSTTSSVTQHLKGLGFSESDIALVQGDPHLQHVVQANIALADSSRDSLRRVRAAIRTLSLYSDI